MHVILISRFSQVEVYWKWDSYIFKIRAIIIATAKSKNMTYRRIVYHMWWQVHATLPRLVLHINDEAPSVCQACKVAIFPLNPSAFLLELIFSRRVSRIEQRTRLYKISLQRLCCMIVDHMLNVLLIFIFLLNYFCKLCRIHWKGLLLCCTHKI